MTKATEIELFEIISTLKLPDGDRLIDVSDFEDEDPPTTFVQSNFSTLPKGELRTFLLSKMKQIKAGDYDD
ncbi:hypothetical protein [Halobacillus trueperi]|uniref:Uncharacterized protein n=1 Tax=Halobacillus trueperi TaxID=156205 RepID=A0A3E0J237_9BACI|nr:hypothetical protein [Halobacillus trueperi]REJ06931.1 hypothetical protein DYE48_17515 [Halobacillus trueperi]